MKKDTSHKEELEQLSPLLAKLKKEDPGLKVPPNYFHNMQVDVLQHLKDEMGKNSVHADSQVGRFPWYKIFFTPKFALAFSTVLVLGVAVFWITRPVEHSTTEELAMDDLSQEEILYYIEENIGSFETDELVEVVSVGNAGTDIFQEVELDDQAVDEYLDKIIDDLDEESFENIF